MVHLLQDIFSIIFVEKYKYFFDNILTTTNKYISLPRVLSASIMIVTNMETLYIDQKVLLNTTLNNLSL